MTSQSNYFIVDSFFSVKSSISYETATSNAPVVQKYNPATIRPNSPQLDSKGRSAMKVRLLSTASASSSDSEATYDTFYIKFPEYFTESKSHNKQIEVEICRLFDMTATNEYTGETGVEMSASMHSDIWTANDSAEHYICSTNTLYNNPKCYTVGDNRSVFEVWFYKPDGSVIDLNPLKTRAIIEFVLKY